MYASFPSRALNEADRLSVCASADDIRMLWRHEMNVFAMDVMPHPDNVMAMVTLRQINTANSDDQQTYKREDALHSRRLTVSRYLP